MYLILKKVGLHLQDQLVPIRDCCKKFETSSGSGEILYSDFTYGLLTDELKLKNILGSNMLDLLSAKFNPNRSENVSYE